jgi:flavin-dependent dehydrogenase
MSATAKKRGMSSLRTVHTVGIIGGGPAGAGCALTLLHQARLRDRQIEVLLLEPKHFGRHFNQCSGVVIRANIEQALAACGERFPEELVQRTISAYALHAPGRDLLLSSPNGAEQSCAMRRVEFDQYLLRRAADAGALVLPDRLTDLEFTDGGVALYTEGETHHVDAVVGAFGLDGGAARAFTRALGYRPPPCLDTLVTKIHPGSLDPIPALLDDRIHALLPGLPRVEFGALIPKGNHVSVTLAGVGVHLPDMQRFLALPQVARLLPPGARPGESFRGAFPLGLARRFCGERYLVAGDAAGLVRPFKGGGINAALMTGRMAGLALLDHGAGPAAAAAYLAACRDLRRDVWYGRRLRQVVTLLSGPLRLEGLMDLADRNPNMRQLLYDCVSGRVPYQQALRERLSLPLLLQAAWACLPLHSPRPPRPA